MLPNLVNFGPDTAENGWRVSAHSPTFSYWQTLQAYSLQQQNARRAQAVLRHAYSFYLFYFYLFNNNSKRVRSPLTSQ